VIVSAYPDRMAEVLPLIAELDAQTKAVAIDVRILQLTINPKFDYGIDWEKVFLRSSGTTLRSLNLRGAFPISSSVSTSSAIGTIGKIAVGAISVDSFTSDIRALKQVSQTKILANPRITVLNGEEAKINIGDRVPYVVTTTTGTGTNVTVSEEIIFIDVGLSVTVTPTINDDGYIIMAIRPEISSRTGTLTTPQKAEIPLINTTFVESTVIVKSGESVILGGLRRDDVTQFDRGVPFLMDVPIFGHLFKSRADTTTRSEIVMLISPVILSPEESYIDVPIRLKPARLPIKTSGNS